MSFYREVFMTLSNQMTIFTKLSIEYQYLPFSGVLLFTKDANVF